MTLAMLQETNEPFMFFQLVSSSALVWGGFQDPQGPPLLGEEMRAQVHQVGASLIGCDLVSSLYIQKTSPSQAFTDSMTRDNLVKLLMSFSDIAININFCTQQRGYPGKMPGGQLKRPGPPLGEHSVIQHTPPVSHHIPPHPVVEDTPSPSKRRKSLDQVHSSVFLLILSPCLSSSV